MLSAKLEKKLKKEGVIFAYLFGSQVSGYTHRESDVDIAVFLSNKIKTSKYFDKSLELSDLFKETYPGRERQVIILNQSPPLLKAEVLRNGQLIFCRDEDALVKFKIDTMHLYEDTKPLRALQYFYLKNRIIKGDFGLVPHQI